jgi:2'-5' RNA ligase
MRLFIASPIILDDYSSIKKAFADIIDGTWVEEKNLHMTWVFLGNMPSAEPIIDIMQSITNLDNQIEIAEIGYFGRPPRIFFARSEHKALYDKAKEFKKLGFDLYRFKPHITLCRIKKIHDYRAYKEKVKAYRKKKLGIILPQIALYESKRTSEGLEYQQIYEIQ